MQTLRIAAAIATLWGMARSAPRAHRAPFSTVNGGHVNRTHGKASRSMKSRSNRRKARG